MKAWNVENQAGRHFLYDASGTITTGGTAQLLLPEQPSRSYLFVQNLSSSTLYLEFGSARATCTISGGVVNSVTITNAGFGFTLAPVVRFEGGGTLNNSQYQGIGTPLGSSPGHPAQGIAVLSGGAVASITITDPGGAATGYGKYVKAPFVWIQNSDLDPYGVAIPSVISGISLPPNAPPFVMNGLTCTTDPIAIFGANSSAAFTCKFMT